MRTGWRLYAYLFVLYLILALFCYRFYQEDPPYLALAEVGLFFLMGLGFYLLHQVFEPIKQLREATQLLREEAFTVRIRPVGHEEMDQLIAIYNQLAERLRQERVFNKEQKFFLEKVLEVTRTAILSFDFDERLETLNPAALKLFGCPAGDLLGRPLSQLNHPLAQFLNGLAVGETRILTYQGRRRLECEHLHFVDRGFYKSFIFINELTEVLRQSEKDAYGKLIRIMAHEINNSLGAASSLLHSLSHYRQQLAEEDRADFQMALDVVISRANHLQTFMSDYSTVVKLPQPSRGLVDLAELLQHIRILMDVELSRRNIQWLWEPRVSLEPIKMDRAQMEQVLVNIIKNAIEAIGQDGTLRLSTAKTGNQYQLIIADSGTGIPEEVATSLFTPFFTTKAAGQGIGLTLIAEILTNHGFDYSLQSPPGEETRFTIWF